MKSQEESSSCSSHSHTHLPLSSAGITASAAKPHTPGRKWPQFCKPKKTCNMWRALVSADQLSHTVYSAALQKSTTVRAMNCSTGAGVLLPSKLSISLTAVSLCCSSFHCPLSGHLAKETLRGVSSTASSADLNLSSWGHTFSPSCPGCIVSPSPLHQHS